MRFVRTPIASLTLLLTLTGCRPTQPVAFTPSDDSPVAGPGSGPAKAAAPLRRGTEILPVQTQFWAEFASMRRLAEVLERDRFESRMATEYGAVASALRGVFGIDPLDVDALPQIGLDPDGEIGFFVLDGRDEALGAYARVNEMGVLRDFISETADRANASIHVESVGSAEVYRDKYDKFGVVVREPYVVFVATGREGSTDWLETLAKTAPDASLAALPEFESVLDGFGEGDAVGYVNPVGIAAQVTAEAHRAEVSNWAVEELQRARTEGASAERIADLERQVAEQQQFNEHYRRRRQAEAELARSLFGGMRAVGVRFDRKPRGPMFQMRVIAPQDALPRKVLRNREGAPLLPGVVDGRLLFMVEGTTEPADLRGFVDLVLRTEGDTFEEAMAEAQRKTGVAFEKRLWPLLTGQGGLAVTLDREPDFGKPDALPESIGLAAYLQVHDADKARLVLDAVLADARIEDLKFRKDRKTGLWSADPKSNGKPTWRRVYVAVAGDNVVVATDPSVVTRIERGGTGNSVARAPDGAYAALSHNGRSLAYAADAVAFGWLWFGYASVSASMEIIESPEDAKVPLSRRHRRKKAELDAVQEQIAKLEQRRQAKAAQKAFELSDKVGMTVATVVEADEGFVVDLGQFLRASSLVEIVEMAVKAASEDSGADPDRAKLQQLWQQRDALSSELMEIRREDLERAKR